MPTKLTERLVESLPLGSGAVRNTEFKGLMVVANKRSTSYCVQSGIWRNKQFMKSVRATIGRTDCVSSSGEGPPRDAAAPSRGRSREASLIKKWTLRSLTAFYLRAYRSHRVACAHAVARNLGLGRNEADRLLLLAGRYGPRRASEWCYSRLPMRARRSRAD